MKKTISLALALAVLNPLWAVSRRSKTHASPTASITLTPGQPNGTNGSLSASMQVSGGCQFYFAETCVNSDQYVWIVANGSASVTVLTTYTVNGIVSTDLETASDGEMLLVEIPNGGTVTEVTVTAN